MGLVDAVRARRWQLAGHRRPLPGAFARPLADARVLEIGGPSAVFGKSGLLPVYGRAASVDNVQWSADTHWHGHQAAGRGFAPDGAVKGVVHVHDGVDLAPLPDGAYDAVISSHVIEHMANPLRALAAWRRVSGGGTLLLVAPHKSGTFDRRRPVTPLEHMVADHEADTPEDDATHVSETLALHDHSRDADPDDDAQWATKRRDNARHRLVHHHTFTTPSLLALLAHAGVRVDAVEVRWPHDIYMLGAFATRGAEPTADVARALRRSPFKADRAGP